MMKSQIPSADFEDPISLEDIDEENVGEQVTVKLPSGVIIDVVTKNIRMRNTFVGKSTNSFSFIFIKKGEQELGPFKSLKPFDCPEFNFVVNKYNKARARMLLDVRNGEINTVDKSKEYSKEYIGRLDDTCAKKLIKDLKNPAKVIGPWKYKKEKFRSRRLDDITTDEQFFSLNSRTVSIEPKECVCKVCGRDAVFVEEKTVKTGHIIGGKFLEKDSLSYTSCEYCRDNTLPDEIEDEFREKYGYSSKYEVENLERLKSEILEEEPDFPEGVELTKEEKQEIFRA